MNIALLSPNRDAYSETFIQAHKIGLIGKIFFYYGGSIPTFLESYGPIQNPRTQRIGHIIKGKYNLNKFSLPELAFIRSLKRNNIDVIFVEYGTTAHNILPVVRDVNLPLLVHFHGYDASITELLKNNDYYKKVFETATYVVVVSKKMYEDFLLWGCPEKKLISTVCSPKDEFFEVEPTFSKQQFISIGRFVDKKAPYYNILAFKEVVEVISEAKLIMAGEGPLLNSCKNLVKYLDLEENVNFVKVISPQEFKEYLKDSLAFVQHSITAENGDSEGTPVAVLEASAAGLPVISTRHAGIPDVVLHGETGLLVDEHDISGMAGNMIKLLKNRKLAIELGRKGKQHIKENFTLEKHLNLLDKLIKSSVNK